MDGGIGRCRGGCFPEDRVRDERHHWGATPRLSAGGAVSALLRQQDGVPFDLAGLRVELGHAEQPSACSWKTPTLAVSLARM